MSLPILRSMTGFASGKRSTSFGTLSIEIQSINRRFLDLHFVLPSSMANWEVPFRHLVQEVLDRGAIKIVIHLHRTEQKAVRICADHALVKGYMKAWKELQGDFFLKGEIDLTFLALQQGVFQVEEQLEEALFPEVEQLIKEVVEMLQMARAVEGKKMAVDLQSRLELLKINTAKIRKITENSAASRLAELKERIKKLVGQGFEDEKVTRQLAIIADNADVSEEIVRLESHLDHLLSWLVTPLSSRQTKGKQLEFFVQELLREVNTLGTKAAGAQISLLVIEMKSEIEKIKEQSQNIE